MAERPIFVPEFEGPRLVYQKIVSFKWHSGMAPVQKKKSIVELHNAAAEVGLANVLEVSTKSDREIGRKLSAFHQRLKIGDNEFTLECVYQASKKFERGGPFIDLMSLPPREAKKDPRLKESGKLTAFVLEGRSYPLSPPNIFYDWIFFRAISPEREWLKRLRQVDGFSDIEFNPAKSINCQARACAAFVSLEARGQLDFALRSFDNFLSLYSVSDI
jgi:uncharacterized protein DUF6977